MATAIAEPKLAEQKKLALEWVRNYQKLHPEKKRRVGKLYTLMEKSDDADERDEIALAIVEIVMPKLMGVNHDPGMTASLDEDVDLQAEKSVSGYHANIGHEIRKRREAKRMTQERLAELSGLPQSHICRLEIGKHAPTRKTIEKIATALGVSPQEIDLLYNE